MRALVEPFEQNKTIGKNDLHGDMEWNTETGVWDPVDPFDERNETTITGVLFENFDFQEPEQE